MTDDVNEEKVLLGQFVMAEAEELFDGVSDLGQRATDAVSDIIEAARALAPELPEGAPQEDCTEPAVILANALARYDALGTVEGAYRVGELEARGSISISGRAAEDPMNRVVRFGDLLRAAHGAHLRCRDVEHREIEYIDARSFFTVLGEILEEKKAQDGDGG